MPFSTPYYRQADPFKQAGQIVNRPEDEQGETYAKADIMRLAGYSLDETLSLLLGIRERVPAGRTIVREMHGIPIEFGDLAAPAKPVDLELEPYPYRP